MAPLRKVGCCASGATLSPLLKSGYTRELIRYVSRSLFRALNAERNGKVAR